MSTRVKRYLVAAAGVLVAYGPGVAASPALRHYVDRHPALAFVYTPLATAAALAAYRELVAWRKKEAPQPAK